MDKLEECLKEKKLKKVPIDKRIAEKEWTKAERCTRSAETALANKDWEWLSTQSYYSCFHASKAMVLLKGFQEKSHYCLAIALDALYAKTSEFPPSLVDTFAYLRKTREIATYETDEISEESAKAALSEAKNFLEHAKKIILR